MAVSLCKYKSFPKLHDNNHEILEKPCPEPSTNKSKA